MGHASIKIAEIYFHVHREAAQRRRVLWSCRYRRYIRHIACIQMLFTMGIKRPS